MITEQDLKQGPMFVRQEIADGEILGNRHPTAIAVSKARFRLRREWRPFPPLDPHSAAGVLKNALNEYTRWKRWDDGSVVHKVEMRQSDPRHEPRHQMIVTINDEFRCGADPVTWGIPWYETKGLNGTWYDGPHFHGEE